MRAFPVSLPRPFLATALAIALGLLVSACGTGGRVSGGDPAHGKQVFTQTCASCHTLQAALRYINCPAANRSTRSIRQSAGAKFIPLPISNWYGSKAT